MAVVIKKSNFLTI